MGDLISRSDLMKKAFVLEGHRVVSYLDVIEAPTAYDAEKVVEVVREDCYSMGFDESQTEIIVDEVKRGGAE